MMEHTATTVRVFASETGIAARPFDRPDGSRDFARWVRGVAYRTDTGWAVKPNDPVIRTISPVMVLDSEVEDRLNSIDAAHEGTDR